MLPIAAAARDLRKDTVGAAGASPRAMLQTLAHVARLAWRLRELQPDLVHTNSLKSGVYGGIAARLTGDADGLAPARPHRRGLPPRRRGRA